MKNAWNNGISKNLPEGASTSEDDFQNSMEDVLGAVNLNKMDPSVMYALYHFDMDDEQQQDDDGSQDDDDVNTLLLQLSFTFNRTTLVQT